MITLKTYLSPVQPAVQNGLWLKPVANGYALYIIGNGAVEPVNIASDNNTAPDTKEITKSVKSELVGKVQDSTSKNTIYGAKNYAKSQIEALKGTTSDTSTDLTLHGLKAYINKKILDAVKD